MKEYVHNFEGKDLSINLKIDGSLLTLGLMGRTFFAQYPLSIDLENVSDSDWELMLWYLFYGYDLHRKEYVDGYNTELPNNYTPSLVPTVDRGDKILISYSGGVDSTALYCALPGSIPVFIDRSYAPVYVSNQLKAVKATSALVIHTDFEKIRALFIGKTGFNVGNGYLAMFIPMLTQLGCKYIAMGAIFGDMGFYYGKDGLIYNGYLEHTVGISRIKVLQQYGIHIVYPLAGLSEVWTSKIVKDSPYKNVASSCHTKIIGNTCGRCYKCLRRYGYSGRKINLNDPAIWRYIKQFLQKKPLKMGCLTIYGLQKANYGRRFERFKGIDVSFCDRYNDTLTRIYTDQAVYDYITGWFKRNGIKPQTPDDQKAIDLFCEKMNDDELYRY